MTSKHYSEDRQARENLIKKIGYGTTISRFVVDRGHRNGAEIHEIMSTGIINIYNKRTNKLITKLIARPNQIRRYYTNGQAPKELLETAYHNYKKHYNEQSRKTLFFFSKKFRRITSKRKY